MTRTPAAFFEVVNDVFVGTLAARGPWSMDHCHAGPVIGLIARAIEQEEEPGKFLTRLTVDLHAPIPLAGFQVQANKVKSGHNISVTNAEVLALDGKILASARGLWVGESDVGDVPTAPVQPLKLSEANEAPFPGTRGSQMPSSFTSFIDVAYPPDETEDLGAKTLWIRTLPLLVGEEPSSFQRICPIADSGSGISRNAEVTDYIFMNPEITILRHRASSSEWLATTARSDWQSNGIGMATSVIRDEDGPVATALQTLLLRKREG
ncbi:MAG: thioesterase family protein [Sneathiellales bacterium]|nr:thioesterase family protein [Sneathiellales bacterium]